jgi:hypothetical protein
MSLNGLFVGTAYQSCRTWWNAAKRFIHYQLGDYPNGPYSISAQVDEQDAHGNSVCEQAKEDEISDIAFFTVKSVLYGWSTYNLVTNNPNPIDVLVGCAAIAETCGYSIEPKRRAI